MKTSILMMGALMASLVGAFAFEIPRGVHSIEALQDAQTKAAEKSKPLVFLYSKKSAVPT